MTCGSDVTPVDIALMSCLLERGEGVLQGKPDVLTDDHERAAQPFIKQRPGQPARRCIQVYTLLISSSFLTHGHSGSDGTKPKFHIKNDILIL